MARRDNRCRDCSFCTESMVTGLVKAPVRIAISPLRAVSWAFRRKCRKCGHPIRDHHRDASGRFQD